MDALLMAIFRRGKPKAILHHSDQGSQYISEDFQRLLESAWHRLQYEPPWQLLGYSV